MYHPRPGEVGKGPRFWPNHIFSELASAVWFMGLIVFLAGFFPHGLQRPADPFVTPEHVKPEWYFLALYQILKLVPKSFLGIEDFNKPATLIFAGVFFVVLMALPWIDKTPPDAQHPRRRLPLVIIFFTGLLLFAGLSYWGSVSK
jgi:quinol-cytochrome oxidoreductase complex cytochrome b subunit